MVSKTIPNKLQIIDNEIQRLDASLVNFIAYQDRDEKPRMTVAQTLEIY